MRPSVSTIDAPCRCSHPKFTVQVNVCPQESNSYSSLRSKCPKNPTAQTQVSPDYCSPMKMIAPIIRKPASDFSDEANASSPSVRPCSAQLTASKHWSVTERYVECRPTPERLALKSKPRQDRSDYSTFVSNVPRIPVPRSLSRSSKCSPLRVVEW